MKNVNRTKQQTADRKMIDGLTKHNGTITSLFILGKSHPTADVIAVLHKRVDDADAAVSAKASWQAAVKADHDGRASTKAFVSGVRQALMVAFAGSADVLADFGLKPPKPREPLTAERKAAVKAKSKATREARHTMGRKQRERIKGEVPATPHAPNTNGANPRS